MSNLTDYIRRHTVRGACQCGRCFDAPADPAAQQPNGHTVDMIFFQVAVNGNPPTAALRELIREHTGEFCSVDLFDGAEHSYLEIGGWIGDQGLALQLMGLGTLLRLWDLFTPRALLGNALDDATTRQLAGSGYITIQAREGE